jgi:hypothetical protein
MSILGLSTGESGGERRSLKAGVPGVCWTVAGGSCRNGRFLERRRAIGVQYTSANSVGDEDSAKKKCEKKSAGDLRRKQSRGTEEKHGEKLAKKAIPMRQG